MILHTLWVWKWDEEGPDLQASWPEWDWPHGDVDAIERMVTEAVRNAGKLSSLGYRLIEIEVEYEDIERLFHETPKIAGRVKA